MEILEVRLQASRQSGADGWTLAWIVAVPLVAVLLYSKSARALSSLTWTTVGALDDSSLRAIAAWLWGFTSLRLLGALLIALVVQRWLLPKRPWLVPFIGAALFALLALATGVAKRSGPIEALVHWTSSAADQLAMIAACTWRDAIVVSTGVLVVGLAMHLCPARWRTGLLRIVQAAVALMTLLVGIDYVQELATGLPTNTHVLLFGLANPMELGAVFRQEATPYRVAVLAAVVLFTAAWTRRTWHLAALPQDKGGMLRWAPAAAAIGASAVLLPLPSTGASPRDTASILQALVRTARPAVDQRIRAEVLADFDRTGQGRWSSAGLKLVPSASGKPRNLVVVMMESMRAKSTTMHTPGLPTTHFLQSLAAKGLMVKDMSAVVPRTGAAWMAILGGQYPLTNEGTAIWAAERGRGAPALRGIPAALHDLGYATAFFSAAHADFLNDRELLTALGFDSIQTHRALGFGDEPDANYFGPADEVMVGPLLAWTRRQLQQGRPFMGAIMTNVGHHPYVPPAHWPRVDFGPAIDPRLDDYYNCLRYVDDVLSRVMRGYEELGVLDDTVFVFVGDHGQMFGEHRLMQSFSVVYEEAVRVPAIIYAPGLVKAGQVVEGTRQQVDLLPTIAQLMGMRVEGARLPGQSLLQPVSAERQIFLSSSIEWTYLGMRRGQRKYVYSFDREPMRVYDLASDPAEQSPLPAVGAAEVEGARSAMVEWKTQVETSTYGHPSRSYRPARSWTEKVQAR